MERYTQERKPVTERVPDNVLISDIPVIEEGGIVAVTKENLAKLVEAPLLEACEELYDLNIRTVMSSANAKDIDSGQAYIAISFDSLSEQNKKIALEFGQPYSMHGSEISQCINIAFNINSQTTVGDVRRMAHEAVSKFHKQDMTWAQRYTLDDLSKIFGIPREEVTPEYFSDMYYDAQSGFLYASEEHYRKANGLK